jgi:hypothetical protein
LQEAPSGLRASKGWATPKPFQNFRCPATRDGEKQIPHYARLRWASLPTAGRLRMQEQAGAVRRRRRTRQKLRDDGLLSLNCGVEEGISHSADSFQNNGIGVCRVVGIAESQRRIPPINCGKRRSGRTPERRRTAATQGKRKRTASQGGPYKKPRADPCSGSSRNGENQNRYVVVPMATAERSRGVKNSFLQFFSGGRAVLLEKAEQPRLSELLALGTGRFRHPVGE